jgi:hypothetical protein
MASITMVMVTMIIIARLKKPQYVDTALAKAAFDADGRSLTGKWANYDYVLITDKSFKGQVEKFVSNPVCTSRLNENQLAKLSDSIATFFKAFNDGSYESYKAFRLPSGVAFNWTTNTFGSLDDSLKNGPHFGTPYARHRWGSAIDGKLFPWGQMSMDSKFQLYLKLYSGTNLYHNYFSAASFRESRIVISNYTSKITPPWEILFWPTNIISHNLISVDDAAFPNGGYFAQKEFYSLIKFEDSIEKTKSQYGSILVVDCFFFVKRSDPDPVLPLIARFYWNPNSSQWLPDDLVICNMWNKGERWPIF